MADPQFAIASVAVISGTGIKGMNAAIANQYLQEQAGSLIYDLYPGYAEIRRQ